MRVAITGGTGFVGGHLATTLAEGGHDVIVLSRGVDDRPWAREVLEFPGVRFVRIGTDDETALKEAFEGCDAVAHCAGINREIGSQTYEKVHVDGTSNVVRAAQDAGVTRLALVSFLRARPHCGSDYHESKWKAEELVRSSTLEWTVVKPGMMFGRGDHMLDHLSRAIYTFPVFLGIGSRRVRPLSVDDLVKVLAAALVDSRLSRKTVGLVGPTQIGFDDAARRVARIVGKRRIFIALPLAFHYLLAVMTEATMTVPLIARAQVRILKEEVIEAVNAPDPLPDDLTPSTPFDEVAIRSGLPKPGRFELTELRWFNRKNTDSTPDATGSILVFDGDCGFCTSTARWAEKGFLHGERAEAWQSLGNEALDSYGLSADDVENAAWWVDPNGTRERGHRAVGCALQVAGGWRSAVGWIILTPPTSWLAGMIYRLVVRWRYRLPGGTPECRVGAKPVKNGL